MPKIFMTLSLLLVALTLAGAAHAQDIWTVSCELELVDIDIPGNYVADFALLTNQPKVADYPDLLTISSPTVGTASAAYSKDADPFGQFVITVTNDLGSGLNAYGILAHTIEPVVGVDWKVQCWLEIELVDTGADGVWLRTDPGLGVMHMLVQNQSNTWLDVTGMTLGLGVDLNTAGTHSFDTGVLAYGGPEAKAMQVIIDFDLSPGDQATLTGRFELSRDLTPVVARTWSGVKGLFR